MRDQGRQLTALSPRVQELEGNGNPTPTAHVHKRAVLGSGYLYKRRSLRLWPIRGSTDTLLWEGVGNFIHDTLRVPVSDVCQDDIETVIKVEDNGLTDRINDEVIVTFFDEKKSDVVMVNSPSWRSLMNCVTLSVYCQGSAPDSERRMGKAPSVTLSSTTLLARSLPT